MGDAGVGQPIRQRLQLCGVRAEGTCLLARELQRARGQATNAGHNGVLVDVEAGAAGEQDVHRGLRATPAGKPSKKKLSALRALPEGGNIFGCAAMSGPNWSGGEVAPRKDGHDPGGASSSILTVDLPFSCFQGAGIGMKTGH